MIVRLLLDAGGLCFGLSGLVGMIDFARGRQLFHLLDFGSLCFGIAAYLDLLGMIT